ncbi:hypothetical protein J7K99_07650, partial [bacterium]|nr:hypothetical protein [bacterium]
LVLYKGVMEQVRGEIEKKGECKLAYISEYLDGRAESYLAQRLFGMDKELPGKGDIEQLLKSLEIANIDRQIEQLQSELKDAERSKNHEKTNEILKKISDLRRKRTILIR